MADRIEQHTANSGFKKLAVQWLIEHSTSYQHLCWVDSLVLRNPLLRKAAKRYGQLIRAIPREALVFFQDK